MTAYSKTVQLTAPLLPGDTLTLTVKAPAPPPVTAPGPQPTPAPTGVLWPPGDTLSQLVSLQKDRTIADIWTSGTYKLPEGYFDGDRGGVPLGFGPKPGDTTTFLSPGKTLSGGVFVGLNDPWRNGLLTIHDIGFDGLHLAQSGTFEVRRASGLSVLRCTSRNPVRDTAYSDKPYKTVFAYISAKLPEGCQDITFADCAADGNARSTSFIQLDNESQPSSQAQRVKLLRNKAANMAYVLYMNIAGSGHVIDGLDIVNSGYGGIAVDFLQGSGTYRLITHDAASDGITNHVPAQWVAVP